MDNKRVAPPGTNRGVQNTEQGGLRALVDWLQVTFKFVSSPDDIIHLLGLNPDDFLPFDTGKYGYDSQLRNGHIAIYYNSIPKDTPGASYYHLEITGQGCREYEKNSKYDWITLLDLILMLDVNITRLDLAIDDFSGYFTVSQVVQKVKRGHVRTRFKKARRIDEFDLKDGQVVGNTVYFGRPSSDIQIRFYDKFQERIAAGKEIMPGVKSWVRTELQLRDKRAALAAYELVNNINDTGRLVKGILSNYINFLAENKKDSNKARWPVCKWWQKFLGDVEKIRLAKSAPDRTVQQVRDWFNKSISASFALLLEAYPPDLILEEFLTEGRSRLKKKHLNMLLEYQADKQQKMDVTRDERERLKAFFLGQKKESSSPEDSAL